MALQVSATARLAISQDIAATPQEVTFDSANKTFKDTTTYAESAGYTFNIDPNAVDQEIDMGSLAEIDMLYLFAKTAGLLIKLVPVGNVLADITHPCEIIPNAPAIIPFKLAAVYVSNPGSAVATIIFGAAGN